MKSSKWWRGLSPFINFQRINAEAYRDDVRGYGPGSRDLPVQHNAGDIRGRDAGLLSVLDRERDQREEFMSSGLRTVSVVSSISRRTMMMI